MKWTGFSGMAGNEGEIRVKDDSRFRVWQSLWHFLRKWKRENRFGREDDEFWVHWASTVKLLWNQEQVRWKVQGPAVPQDSDRTEMFRWNESLVDILIQLYLTKHDFVLLRRKYLVESAVRVWNPVSFTSLRAFSFISVHPELCCEVLMR